MRPGVILVVLAACGAYPQDTRLPEEPLAACGEILRRCYATWRACDAERYPPCESGCAADYVYEHDIQACVEACYPCTRDRIACMTDPSCSEAQKVCEDGAHALAEIHDVSASPELLCLAMCEPGVGSPSDGCDPEAGEVCRELATLADASKLHEEGPLFACQ